VGFPDDYLEKIGKIGIEGASEPPDSLDTDREYGAVVRRHRMLMFRLESWKEILFHPTPIFVTTAVMLAVFLATRYMGIHMGNDLLMTVSGDFRTALSYVGTVILTHMVTRLLDNGRK